MCGLSGVAGAITPKERDAFNELMWGSALRGKDSTGVAAVRRHSNDVEMCKVADDVTWLFYNKNYDKVVGAGSKVLMGHCRHATIGAKKVYNAHPFAFEHLVGAHNGTLQYGSKGKLSGSKDFDTDSEALFNHMNEVGPEETIPLLEGAWALTWFDKTTNDINFLRNGERPLAYAFNESRDCLFWASEPGLLRWVLARNNIKTDGETIHWLATDMWSSWEIPEWGKPFGERKTYEKLEGFQPAPPPYSAPQTSGAYPRNSSAEPSRKPRERGDSSSGIPPLVESLQQLRARSARERLQSTTPHGTSEQWPSAKDITPKHILPSEGSNKLITSSLSDITSDTKVVDLKARREANQVARHRGGTRSITKPAHITYKDERGQPMTKKEFELRTKHGCDYCIANIAWQDKCKFTKDDGVLCETCCDDPLIMSYF